MFMCLTFVIKLILCKKTPYMKKYIYLCTAFCMLSISSCNNSKKQRSASIKPVSFAKLEKYNNKLGFAHDTGSGKIMIIGKNDGHTHDVALPAKFTVMITEDTAITFFMYIEGAEQGYGYISAALPITCKPYTKGTDTVYFHDRVGIISSTKESKALYQTLLAWSEDIKQQTGKYPYE